MTATEELVSRLHALPDAQRERVARRLLDALADDLPSGDGETAAIEPSKPSTGFADIAHLIGCVDSGISDLGSNKAHLEDLGKSSMS
jgi:hypothetical protein